MNFFMYWVVFLSLFSITWSQKIQKSCDECIEFIKKSSQLFASDEVIGLTEEFLKIDVCPLLENEDECKKGIDKWYKPMIKAGLDSEDFGSRFCYHYGLCINYNDDLNVRHLETLNS